MGDGVDRHGNGITWSADQLQQHIVSKEIRAETDARRMSAKRLREMREEGVSLTLLNPVLLWAADVADALEHEAKWLENMARALHKGSVYDMDVDWEESLRTRARYARKALDRLLEIHGG